MPAPINIARTIDAPSCSASPTILQVESIFITREHSVTRKKQPLSSQLDLGLRGCGRIAQCLAYCQACAIEPVSARGTVSNRLLKSPPRYDVDLTGNKCVAESDGYGKDAKMIGAKIQEAFNKQLNAELYSSYLYVSMSSVLRVNQPAWLRKLDAMPGSGRACSCHEVLRLCD